jgi:flavin-dependent dehydrogenase
LTVGSDGRRVTGVKTGDEKIATDIIIDATGRDSAFFTIKEAVMQDCIAAGRSPGVRA